MTTSRAYELAVIAAYTKITKCPTAFVVPMHHTPTLTQQDIRALRRHPAPKRRRHGGWNWVRMAT